MLKRIVCTLLLVLVSFSFSVNASAMNRFQWITSSDFLTASYDTQSVKYYNSTYGKIVDVWISWKFTEEGAKNYVEDGRAHGFYPEEKWDNFSYSLDHWLLSKSSHKCLETIYYDVNGTVIYKETYGQNAKWYDIVPGSFSEKIRNNFIDFLADEMTCNKSAMQQIQDQYPINPNHNDYTKPATHTAFDPLTYSRADYARDAAKRGITNPFLIDMMWNTNYAPLVAEAHKKALEDAMKVYYDPNSTAQDKTKAQATIAFELAYSRLQQSLSN